MRGPAAVAGLAAALLLLSGVSARAQVVCVTSGADVTCTNSGTNSIGITASNVTGNATAINSGTNTNGIIAATITGNATATNSGSNAGGIVAATTAGNAAATNSGSNTGGSLIATTGIGNATMTNSGGTVAINTLAVIGNATTVNSGTDAGQLTTVAGTGNAATSNSGSVGGQLVTQSTTGNATTTNSGSVGGQLISITATGDTITSNSGSVSGQLVTQSISGNATTTNSGSVVIQLVTQSLTGNATTANSGSVVGLLVTSTTTGSATTTNSGSVGGQLVTSTTAGNATTINSGTVNGQLITTATGGSALLVNSGTINSLTIVAASSSATLTNSGTISNVGGPAILFVGGPDALSLLAGSRISGAIDLVGAHDTVNFLGGNHNLTFNTLAGATMNGPDPVVVVGNRAVAIDPTPFGLADKNLMDFTRGVSGILGSLGGVAPGPSGTVSSAVAPSGALTARVDDAFASIAALAYSGDHAMAFKAPTVVDQSGRSVWVRAFGGGHVTDADGALLHSTNIFTGGAVGFDVVSRPDLRLGVFAGGGESRFAADLNVSRVDTDTAFGGVYGRWGFAGFGAPSFVDFALHGGGSRNTSSRTINNNTLAGGIEVATASHNGWYISPEIAYGVNLPLWSDSTLTPSLRLRYVGGLFDGYTETGSTANLTVASRTLSDFEERGELKLTRAARVGPDLLLTSLYVGGIGIERAGDTTVNAVVLGASLPFVTPGRNAVAGVVGGGGLEWRTREGVAWFGAAEAIGFSDSSTVVSARGGLRVAF